MSFQSIALKDAPGWLFPFTDTSGTTLTDVSGNGNDGTLVGSPTLDQRSLIWKPWEGASMLFNGTTQRVTVPGSVVTTTTYTYEFLIRPETVSGVQCLAHDGTNGIYINGGKLSFYYSAAYHDADTTLVAGNEYLLHVAVTAGAVQFSVNRAPDGTASGAPVFSANSLFAENGGGAELHVSACIAACYPGVALSRPRIRRHYRAAFLSGFYLAMQQFAPLIHLTGSESSGTIEHDISGNYLDGTISGSPALEAATSPVHTSTLMAMALDGANDETVVAYDAQMNSGSAFTVIQVIRQTGSSESRGLAGRWVWPDQREWLFLSSLSGDNKLRLYLSSDGSTATAQQIETTGVAPSGNFEVLGAVYSSGVVDLYRNGLEVASGAQGTIPSSVYASTADLVVGNGSAGGAYPMSATGRADFIFIKSALSAQQMQQISAALSSRIAADVIAKQARNAYRFNESSGNAIDVGALGTDGTWTGSPTYGNPSTVILNETDNKSISVTTAESLSITSDIAANTYSMMLIGKPAGVSGTQKLFDDGTNGFRFNGDKMSLFYSAAEHDSNTALLAGVAHLFGVSVDAGAVTFNLDGYSDGSASGAPTIDPDTMFDSTCTLDADEAAVFASALTEDDWMDIADAMSLVGYGIIGALFEELDAEDWLARAHDLSDGTLLGTAPVVNGIYSLALPAGQGRVLASMQADIGLPFVADATYSVGDYLQPTRLDDATHFYKCTVAGVAGAEPGAWNTAGGTSTSGACTFQDMGLIPEFKTQICQPEEG